MSPKKISIALIVISFLAFTVQIAHAAYVPGQILIKYNDTNINPPATPQEQRNRNAAAMNTIASAYGLPAHTYAAVHDSLIDLIGTPNLPNSFLTMGLFRIIRIKFNSISNDALLLLETALNNPAPLQGTGVTLAKVRLNTAGTTDSKDKDGGIGGTGSVAGSETAGEGMPNDPFFGPSGTFPMGQWSLYDQVSGPDADIDFLDAWHKTEGSSDVIIAIIDSGVKYDHEDLVGKVRMDLSWDFIDALSIFPAYPCDTVKDDCANPDNNPMDAHGHGTHVASTAVALTNNSKGIAGVCPNCVIMALKAGYRNTAGGTKFSESAVEQAIAYAIAKGADIINLSLYWYGDLPEDYLFYDEIQSAVAEGVVVIAAAGNYYRGYPYQPTQGYPDPPDQVKRYPAAMPGVIAVGGTDSNNARFTSVQDTCCVDPDNCGTCYYESCYGDWVDIAAPGKDVVAAKIDSANPAVINIYRTRSGTSMATPHVAGVAGLLLSLNPDLTNLQIEQILKNTALQFGSEIPSPDQPIGTGILNAFRAINTQNQRPVIEGTNPPQAIMATVGVKTEFDLLVNDNDALSPEGTLNVTMVTASAPAGSTFDAPGDPHRLMFRWTPAPGQTCPCVALFRADDGVNEPTPYYFVNIEMGTNHPPEANAGPDNEFIKESPEANFPFSISGGVSSDPDGNSIYYAWTIPPGFVLHPGSAINSNTLTFITTPDVLENTYYTFTINVCDRNPLFANPAALCDSDDVRIRLLAQNDPPEFIVMPPSSMGIHVGDPVPEDFDLYVQDPNPTDTLTVNLASIPPGVDNVTADTLHFDPLANKADFRWTPLRDTFNGLPFSPVFQFVVTDSGLNNPSLPLSDTYGVTINVQNEGPSFTPVGPLSWVVGKPFEMSWNITDAHGDDVVGMTGSWETVMVDGVQLSHDTFLVQMVNQNVQTTFDPVTDVFTVRWPSPFLLAQLEGGTNPDKAVLAIWAGFMDKWFTKSAVVPPYILTMKVFPNETQAPSVTISTPTGSSTTSKQLYVTATDNSQLKTLKYFIDVDPVANPTATPYQTWSISGTSYTKNYTPSLSLSYSTTHYYYVQAEDLAGNKYTASRSFYYYYQSSGGGSGSGSGSGSGGDIGGCFLPGTPISMADGSMKPIESVVIGDSVVAYDEEEGELATDTVSQVFIHNDVHTGYLEINDMKVTSEHPLWVKDKGWVKAGEVIETDILLRQDGTDEPITHIKPVEGKYTVHNLETSPHHTYYAQGKRVHNKPASPGKN